MNDEKVCRTCDWYNLFQMVCWNGESEYCGEFCGPYKYCKHWEHNDLVLVPQ